MSNKELEVIYEPHPVSPERKEDLRARGYRIVDAVFAPDGYEHPDDSELEPVEMSSTELREALSARGVEFRSNASRSSLKSLYDEALEKEATGSEA